MIPIVTPITILIITIITTITTITMTTIMTITTTITMVTVTTIITTTIIIITIKMTIVVPISDHRTFGSSTAAANPPAVGTTHLKATSWIASVHQKDVFWLMTPMTVQSEVTAHESARNTSIMGVTF